MLRYSVSQDFNPGTVRTACLCPSWWSHLKARSLRIRGWMLAVGPEVHWGCQPDPSMWLGLLHSLVAGCQGGASGNKTRATWPLYPPSQAASLPPHFLDWGSYEGPPGFKELNTDISIAMSLPCPSSTLEEEHKGRDISLVVTIFGEYSLPRLWHSAASSISTDKLRKPSPSITKLSLNTQNVWV